MIKHDHQHSTIFFKFCFKSGDDTEEVNQDQLNGNQDYENGDLDMDMDVGFDGKLVQ